MAKTTGTTAFNLDMNELIEEAFERCGKQLRSGYDFRTARRSLNLLLLDWANRGINLWTVEQGVIPMVTGQAIYPYPVDTIDMMDMVIRQNNGTLNQIDINISRIAEPTYMSLPNKLAQGRPIQVWVNRQSGATYAGDSTTTPPAGTDNPKIVVWPTPDGSQTYTFVYWRMRRIQDAGTGSNTMDVPFRFIPAMVAGLAYYIALKIPSGYDRLPVLKQQYDEAWELAASEDREKAAIRFVPRQQFIGGT